jgi:hypothetical protein
MSIWTSVGTKISGVSKEIFSIVSIVGPGDFILKREMGDDF